MRDFDVGDVVSHDDGSNGADHQLFAAMTVR